VAQFNFIEKRLNKKIRITSKVMSYLILLLNYYFFSYHNLTRDRQNHTLSKKSSSFESAIYQTIQYRTHWYVSIHISHIYLKLHYSLEPYTCYSHLIKITELWKQHFRDYPRIAILVWLYYTFLVFPDKTNDFHFTGIY